MQRYICTWQYCDARYCGPRGCYCLGEAIAYLRECFSPDRAVLWLGRVKSARSGACRLTVMEQVREWTGHCSAPAGTPRRRRFFDRRSRHRMPHVSADDSSSVAQYASSADSGGVPMPASKSIADSECERYAA